MTPPGPLKAELLKGKKQVIAIFIIILFHSVGLIGFLVPGFTPVFLKIVPWHLLLMLMVVLLCHQDINYRFLFFVLCLFISGYGIEWTGVHTHQLFGNYYYGETLGIKLSDVPITIGINWLLLIYTTGVLMQRSRLKSMPLRIVTGALLPMLLDILIEPVAAHLDYWNWANDNVPLKNYGCWFLVSCFMLLIFELFRFKKQSIVGPVYLFAQFVFFAVLYWS
jgi:bisanhydrobacterioruberin hydratase